MNKASLTLLAIGMAALPAIASANDFSTVTRVQYVMDCMNANKNMNVYESVHKCSCVVDKLSEVFTQREFEDINTGYQLRNLPADRGGMFRDDADVQDGLSLFKKTHEEAYKSCRIR